MNEERTTVGIVDDHTLFRDGLANLLKEYSSIEIVLKASNGQDLKDKLMGGTAPDVILMDINMPVMDGYEATYFVRQRFPLVQVLALSMYEDEASIIKMIKKGASGYILKECTADELVRAIQSLKNNGYYINELVSGRLLHSLRDENTNNGKRITEKEQEFLRYCCSELTYKEIADELGVSPRTVDSYRDILFEKLQIKSRVGLVLYAIRNDIYKL